MSSGTDQEKANDTRSERDRQLARVNLVKDVVAIIGNEIIREHKHLRASVPQFLCWNGSRPLQDVLNCYDKWRGLAFSLMQAETATEERAVEAAKASSMVIDRHKVSAAFLMAILEAKPLTLSDTCRNNFRLYEVEAYANELLAFKSAMAVLGIFARTQGREDNDIVLTKMWTRQMFYPKTKGASPFQRHACRMLRFAKDQGALNLPMLSNWIFMIEKHHEVKCRLDELYS